MHYVWWTLVSLLIAAGLVGTLVPLLPGTALILCGAVLDHFTVEPPHRVGWWTLSALVVLMVLSYVVDFTSGTVGAKWFGATRWGAVGGLIGTVVGLFFGLIGLFVGPLVGVLVGELIGGKDLVPAGKSTWGTLLGTTAGLIARFIIGCVMVAWFVAAAFFL